MGKGWGCLVGMGGVEGGRSWGMELGGGGVGGWGIWGNGGEGWMGR